MFLFSHLFSSSPPPPPPPHPQQQTTVAGVTPAEDDKDGRKRTLVTCVDDERLELEDGMRVSFSELVGAEELLSDASSSSPSTSFLIANCKPTSFELVGVDCSSFKKPYERGGVVVQVKQPKTLAFAPLSAAAEEPLSSSTTGSSGFLVSDFSKFDRPPLLHLGFAALDAFQVETGRLPRAWDEGDAAKLLELAAALNDAAPVSDASRKVADLDLSSPDSEARKVLSALSFTAAAELSPLAAVFGGVVGQEVVKAASGKFHPIHQFFYFDAMEVLPPSKPVDADVEGVVKASPALARYESQIAVFGAEFQRRLARQRVFLVGAGALGCEFLKAFALMGVGTADGSSSSSSSAVVGGTVEDDDPPPSSSTSSSEKGLVTVTDDDTIEKSNLSRQFLFRDWDIGQAKSTAAAREALRINPALRVRPLQNRVSPDTEAVFGDSFWGGLSLVVNALDNVTARLYVDARCVYFGKPLLESGTLGPKCNTQAVIPGLTENYGASRDPPERQAPMCTVHSFPHTIDHCLTWARSEFEGCLVSFFFFFFFFFFFNKSPLFLFPLSSPPPPPLPKKTPTRSAAPPRPTRPCRTRPPGPPRPAPQETPPPASRPSPSPPRSATTPSLPGTAASAGPACASRSSSTTAWRSWCTPSPKTRSPRRARASGPLQRGSPPL